MTIKKRLFISNIFMIVIPAVLAVIVLAGCLLIFLISVFSRSGYQLGFQEELTEIRYKATELAENWLKESDPNKKAVFDAKLSQLSAENQMTIQIKDGGKVILQTGTNEIPSQSRLEQSLSALDGKGTVSDGIFDLCGTQISLDGRTYGINLYNPVVAISYENIKIWMFGIGIFMMMILFLSVFLTNRFLTKFVFQRISDPLQTLAEGVRQIRDGNLTHKIFYTEPDEFQPVCEDFNDMAERLRLSVLQSQKEEENRKELLASISHDIRSPLTSIRAYVEGLLDGVANTPEKQKAYLFTIQKKTMEIDEMVKKVFLFSKMDMDEYPYSPEKLDVGKELREFVIASLEEYQHKGLLIKMGNIPQHAFIEADPIYFRSILINLLDNSAKYKEKQIGTAFLTGEIAGEKILLYVDDDGPGVPSEVLNKLFEAFYRNDPSRKNPNQGSGLGLAIVSKAIKRMGGAIYAENLPGGGLRMAMEMPLIERTV